MDLADAYMDICAAWDALPRDEGLGAFHLDGILEPLRQLVMGEAVLQWGSLVGLPQAFDVGKGDPR